MKQITQEELNEVILLHGRHLYRWPGGFSADFSGYDLSGLSLFGSDLRAAKFCGALLVRANLTGANLSGADFTGANLTDAKLLNAAFVLTKLNGAVGLPDLYDPELLPRIAAIVAESPKCLDMNDWHSSCGTAHCIAGWACVLSEKVRAFESVSTTYLAARLALGDKAARHFYDTDGEAIAWLSGLGTS